VAEETGIREDAGRTVTLDATAADVTGEREGGAL